MRARLKDRRLKRNPMKERLLKARKLMKMAAEAQAQGKLGDAARHARMAMEYAPQDAEIVLDTSGISPADAGDRIWAYLADNGYV